MKLLCFHCEPRTDDTSYSRAVYCAEITPPLFDAFFNSPLSYRGAYFVSPETGLEANRLLFNVLTPSLVSWATQRYSNLDQDWMTESLSLPSAKAWLAEEPLALCNACVGQWSTSYRSELQIENGRWELSKHVHATWGRQAPQLTKVRFFGGFVNSEHQEWIASHKLGRAKQIWEHGWS
jgi:hypothetical protein